MNGEVLSRAITDEEMTYLNRYGLDANLGELWAGKVDFHVEPGSHGRPRQVTATTGGKVLDIDRFDMADRFRRQNFCKSVADKMAVHGGRPDLVLLDQRLLAAISDAPADGQSMDDADESPVLTSMADVESRPIRWLWKGRVPLGRITLFVGRPGEGKSVVSIDMAARVTTGSPWPDGEDCPKGSVIFICAEDDPADTIRPRLDAAGADVHRVRLLASVRRMGAGGEMREVMFTLRDVKALEAALKQVTDCLLIVVDPIGSFLGGGTDAHRDNEVRAVLAPVAQLAEKYGPAVVVVAHRRKSAGSVADDLALGSRAFTGIARAVWHVSRDSENKDRRLLLPGKNNLAREGNGLAFQIVGEPPRVHWERNPVSMSADDALAAENAKERKKPGPEPRERDEASAWLKKALALGPRPMKEVAEEARETEGISKATLERAKKATGVVSYQPEKPGPWWWRLGDAQKRNGGEVVEPDDLAEVGESSGNDGFDEQWEGPEPQVPGTCGPGDWDDVNGMLAEGGDDVDAFLDS